MKSTRYHTNGYGRARTITPYLASLVVLLFCGPASPGRFVNLAETATFPRGEGEVVQVTTFSTCNNLSCQVDALEFQVGVEYGLVDHLQVGFALPNVVTSWTEDYQATDSIYLGLEGDWHLDHSDGSRWNTVGRHLGPNISVDTGPIWITAAAHFPVGSGGFNPEQIFQTHVGLPF